MNARRMTAVTVLVLAIGLARNTLAGMPPSWSQTGWRTIASYDYANDTWTIAGFGQTEHFVYKSLKGDGLITARVLSITPVCPPNRQHPGIYVFILENLDYMSRGAMEGIALKPDGTFVSQWCKGYGNSQSTSPTNINGLPHWIRVERRGSMLTGYRSLTGSPGSWTQTGSHTISMSQELYVGFWATFLDPGVQFTAKIDHITVEGDASTATTGPDSDWWVSGKNMESIPDGNVGIGVSNPQEKLQVRGVIHSTSGGFKFPDGSIQTKAAMGGGGSFDLPYTGSTSQSGSAFSITNTGSGNGIFAKGGSSGYAGDFQGKVRVRAWSSGNTVLELGEGLDYAEGFDVSGRAQASPGSVLVIDSAQPGKLKLSERAYDKTVAGIVAGGQSLGSGVRLGVGQFDCDVALAGRVYCNVDATKAGITPGDLLTTSDLPGYAMKVRDSRRAQGAILGKAMQPLEKGQKGQILVLVTLQ